VISKEDAWVYGFLAATLSMALGFFFGWFVIQFIYQVNDPVTQMIVDAAKDCQ